MGTPAGIANCVVERSACELERVFAAAEPRAGELLVFAGVPIDRRAALACLPNHGGTGEDVDLEATAGKAIAKCETGIKKASSALVRGEPTPLAKCAGRSFSCVLTKRNDVACPAKAAAGCAKDLAKIDAAASKVGPAIAKKCGAPLLDYDLLRQAAGAHLDALATECAERRRWHAHGPRNGLRARLVRQHACRVTTLLRVAMPRAQPLIEALTPAPPFAFPTSCPP